MTDTTGAAPAAPTTPAAGSPTYVSQPHKTDYQPASPAAAAPAQPAAPAAEPAKPAEPAVQPPAVEPKPAEGAPDPAKVPPEGEFKLPDEYKDKSWAAKIKSQDDLYKQIDNLTALAGKKSVVPNLKEATPEAREEFYAQLRGKDAAEYPIPSNPAFPTPPETQPVVAKLFMDNGVSPTQAEAIIKGYQEMGAKQIAAQYDPEGFKASMVTAFGNDWEKVTGQVRNTIKGMMNADDQKVLENLPNHMLGTVYRTLGNTIKAFGVKETDNAHFSGPGKAAPSDVGSVRQGLRDQLAALSMRPHTSDEQKSIIDQLNKTYENDPRLQQA